VTREANIALRALACPAVPKCVPRTRRKLVDVVQLPLPDPNDRQTRGRIETIQVGVPVLLTAYNRSGTLLMKR
jgi:hypothetical protein